MKTQTFSSLAELRPYLIRPTMKARLINGARAVGRANGANPIPIVIPCHRVIGSNGELVGFGGGLPLKRALLELEDAITVQPSLF